MQHQEVKNLVSSLNEISIQSQLGIYQNSLQIQANYYGEETAQIIYIHKDTSDARHIAFVSGNYSLNLDQFREAFGSHKLNLVPISKFDDSFLKLLKTNSIYIDGNLLNSSNIVNVKIPNSSNSLKIRTSLLKQSKYLPLNVRLKPKYRAKVDFVSPIENRSLFENVGNHLKTAIS